jgi:hypothetical protein
LLHGLDRHKTFRIGGCHERQARQTKEGFVHGGLSEVWAQNIGSVLHRTGMIGSFKPTAATGRIRTKVADSGKKRVSTQPEELDVCRLLLRVQKLGIAGGARFFASLWACEPVLRM